MIPCSFKKRRQTKADIKTKVCWLWSSDNHLLSSLLWVLWPDAIVSISTLAEQGGEQLVLQTESIRREKISFRMIRRVPPLWWQPFDILSHIVFSQEKGLSDNRGISIEWKDIEGVTQRKKQGIFYWKNTIFQQCINLKELWYEYDMIKIWSDK